MTIEIQGDPSVHKNVDGHLGPICGVCGGFGFTMTFSGSSGCYACNQTGIAAPTNSDLEERVARLEAEILGLKGIVVRAVERSAQ